MGRERERDKLSVVKFSKDRFSPNANTPLHNCMVIYTIE